MDILKGKPLKWLGDSFATLQAFPGSAQRAIGYQLRKVQNGLPPEDFKPVPSVGKGVEEIRVWVESGTYRVIYIARFEEAVYVLHAFPKKAQQTTQRDLSLASQRYASLLLHRKGKLPLK